MEIQFKPISFNHKIVDNTTVVEMYGRLNNEKIVILDKEFLPYFVVILKEKYDEFSEKVVKLTIEDKFKVVKVEKIKKNYLGQEVDAAKIYVNVPSAVTLIKDIIRDWIFVKSVHEYDISFVNRYLIDKGIKPLVAMTIEVEQLKERNRCPSFELKEIKDVGGDVDVRMLAIDIETYNPDGKGIIPEKNPIIMVSLYGDNFEKVITWKRFKTDLDYIEFVSSEMELLEKLRNHIVDYKPDVICGYNSDNFDFPYIMKRVQKYGVEFDIGDDFSKPLIKGKNNKIAFIAGIVHFDVYSFIRKNLGKSMKTDSFSLSNVSQELLGSDKDDVEISDLYKAWDDHPEQLEKYCMYNLKDSNLTYNLLKKIWANAEEFVKLIGWTIFDVNRMSFSQLVECYLIRQAKSHNEISPNRPSYHQVQSRSLTRIKGAFVYEPKPGLHDNIAVFDFRSLYPSIITSHNICLNTLNVQGCEDNQEKAPLDEEIYFCKNKKGFLPTVLEKIITRRIRVKEILKNTEDRKMKNLLNARSGSLKLLANSLYGYLAYSNARWYSIECAQSITAYARHYIKKVIKEAEESGFEVLYGDTDSIFMILHDKTKKDASLFVEKFNETLPGLMELDFEDIYVRGLFVSLKDGREIGAKKRYAMITENGTFKIKGFEAVRRNVSSIAKEVQMKVFEIILRDNDKDKALTYVKGVINDIRDKNIDKNKLIITTQLSREIKDYENEGPHVAVAKKMVKDGAIVGPGVIISYIITPGSGILRDRAEIPEKVTEYDSDYYINRQIIPVVERVFNAIGVSREELVEEKSQSKLESFFG